MTLNLALIIIMLVACFTGSKEHFYTESTDQHKDTMKFFMMGIFVFILYLYYESKIIRELLGNMLGRIQSKGEYQTILEKSEDPMVIVSDDKIEFANDRFLYEFKDSISGFGL